METCPEDEARHPVSQIPAPVRTANSRIEAAYRLRREKCHPTIADQPFRDSPSILSRIVAKALVGTGQGESMPKWAVTIVIVFVVAMMSAYFTKPDCRSGYVPFFDFINRWSCVPGYKP